MPDADTLERPAVTADLRVDRDQLLTAVRAVNQAVERRNTIPILSNVMLRCEGGFLKILATDLDHWSARQIEYVGAPIDTTVEADRLITAIDTLRPGSLDISYLHGALTIKQGRSTRKLMTLPSTDFPVAKPAENATEFAMDSAPLLRILEAARVAVSTEEARYYLCGVFFEVVDGKIVAAATDGHRVVQITHPAPDGAAGAPASIIGTKAVNLICSMLDAAPDGAQALVALDKGKFQVIVGQALISGKLVDARYPDYRRVFRYDHVSSLLIQASELDRTIRAAGSATDGKTSAVRLDLSTEACEASGTAQDGGRSVEPLDGDYDGPELTTGINLIYAQSIAKMFGATPKLKLAFGAEGRDLIVITSDDRPGMIAGIMPMRA